MRRRLPIADHEPRSAVVSRSPRLGDPVLGLVADARYLVDDLTPSLDADALPIRAFEYDEELTVGVTEAGSDLDLHDPRIRLDDAGSGSGRLGLDDERGGTRRPEAFRTYPSLRAKRDPTPH
jgi:hypothetical protein